MIAKARLAGNLCFLEKEIGTWSNFFEENPRSTMGTGVYYPVKNLK